MKTINDEAASAFITELVKRESVSRNERVAVEFLVEQMHAFGFDRTYIDDSGSAIGIRNPDGQGPMIALLGHIDTVPGNIPVRIEDNVLYGRGSVDAKGPLAAFVVAAATCDIPANVRIVVGGAVEEESATSKGARQIARDFQPDACVIGEPSGASAMTLGYKGRLLMKYKIEVDQGHTAGPLPSAAEYAAAFWNVVQSHADGFNQERELLFDQLQPSLREFNTLTDGMTDQATMLIGCRLPLNFDAEVYQGQLQEHLRGGATVRYYAHETAHRSGRSTPIVAAFSAAIRKEFDKAAKFKLKTGTADMNVVAPVWKCPILAYGPGDSTLDHTPNEHLHLNEYLQSIRVLRDAIQRLATRLS